jgi:hypothetical protein
MSRQVHQAAFAIASDGTLLLNVAHVDRRLSPSQLLQWALEQRGKVFVGLQMSPAETKKVVKWSGDVHTEAVAYILGPRERRARRSKRRVRY